MRRRLLNALIPLVALACLTAGQPWLLFGQEGRLFVEERYATAQDLSPGPAFSEAAHHEEEPSLGDGEKWTFTADRVVAQHDSEYVEALGEATFKKGSNVLRADMARYYRATGWILLKGNVRALWEGDFLEADEAEFDLRNKTGWLKNGKVFVAKPHLYFESDYVRKFAAESYEFKNAKVTACSGETPDWSFTAEEGEITIDGYAKLWHTAFNIRDVPVVYLPYIQVPTSAERKSGFLFPEISVSDRFGLHVNLPYYWAINEEMDATLYQNVMTERGYMQGLELRLALDTHTKGLIRFDWLQDSETYASFADEDHLVAEDGLLRPNEQRWWFRSKYDGYLGTPAWRFMADVDLVSDQDYLKEFNDGYSGYQASRDEFVREFGRDIDPADDLERESTLLAMRDYEDVGVSAKLAYTQNLAYFNGNDDDSLNPTAQRLPELSGYLFKDAIGDTPLEFEASSSLAYFSREYGETGGRFTLSPTLSLPVTTPWITVIPSIGATEVFYIGTDAEDVGNRTQYNEVQEDGNSTDDGFSHTFSAEASVSVFSEVYRTYDYAGSGSLALTEENVGNSEVTGLKHSLIPRVDYTYEPTLTGLADRPYYDQEDRFPGQNKVTYSLTNVLDRKVETVSLLAENGQVAPALTTGYEDFLRFRLEQSYDFNEAERTDETDRYSTRPFSDLTAELILTPTAGLSLTSKTHFNLYDTSVSGHESLINYEYPGLGSVYMGFDYQDSIDEYTRKLDESLSMLRLGGDYYLTPNLIIGVDYRVNLLNGRDVSKSISLDWQSECWRFGVEYSRTESSGDRFGLTFKLFEF